MGAFHEGRLISSSSKPARLMASTIRGPAAQPLGIERVVRVVGEQGQGEAGVRALGMHVGCLGAH